MVARELVVPLRDDDCRSSPGRMGATIGEANERRSVEMAIVEANPNLGAEIVADAKEYVL